MYIHMALTVTMRTTIKINLTMPLASAPPQRSQATLLHKVREKLKVEVLLSHAEREVGNFLHFFSFSFFVGLCRFWPGPVLAPTLRNRGFSPSQHPIHKVAPRTLKVEVKVELPNQVKNTK